MYNEPQKLLSTREAADLLGYSFDYVSKMCRNGQIPAIRSGNSWLIAPDALEAFKRAHTAKLDAFRQAAAKRAKGGRKPAFLSLECGKVLAGALIVTFLIGTSAAYATTEIVMPAAPQSASSSLSASAYEAERAALMGAHDFLFGIFQTAGDALATILGSVFGVNIAYAPSASTPAVPRVSTIIQSHPITNQISNYISNYPVTYVTSGGGASIAYVQATIDSLSRNISRNVGSRSSGSSGGTADLSSASLEDLGDVGAMTKAFGDLLYWNGSAWSNIATSSLGITGGGGVPGGVSGQVQFNDGGAFGGDGGFTYDKVTHQLFAANASTTAFSSSYASSTQGFFGTLSIGALDGPLQANGGVVSATTSIGAIYGGTGQTSYSVGDLLYADSPTSLATLPVSTNGLVLKLVGGLPSWQPDMTSGGGGGAGAWATTTDSLAIYPSDPSNVVIVGSSATSSLSAIFEVHGKSYFSNFVGIGTTSAATNLSVQGNGLISGNLGVANLTATGTLAVSGKSTLTYASTTGISSPYASSTNFFAGNVTIGSLTGVLKATAGLVSVATAGTDYENPLTFAFPLVRTVNAISLAFGTTTQNFWSAYNNFSSLFATNASSTNATTTSLGINNETFTDLTGAGLQNIGGALSINATGDWTGTFDGQEGSYYLANSFSTTSARYFTDQYEGATTTASASGPLSFSTNPVVFGNSPITLSISQANGSTNGYLSSTDFTTFNNKISSTSLSGGTGVSYNPSTGVISATGLGSYDAFTHPSAGQSATTSLMLFNGAASSTQLSATQAYFGGTGTTTISATGALTTPSLTIGSLSGVLKATAGLVSAATAGTDYENPLTFAYPLVRSINAISLAFGTTTQNFWSAYNNFSSLFATNASSTNATTTNLHVTGLAGGGVASDANGRIYSAATTTAGTGLTYSGNAFNVNTSQNIATLSNLTTDGVVYTSGGAGTLNVDSGALDVSRGGTGWANIQAGAIPYGAGTGALATTTQGTGGFVLAWANGIPSWVATSSINNGVSSLIGTTNQITASASTGAVTLSIPNRFIFPSSYEATYGTTTYASSTALSSTYASSTNAFFGALNIGTLSGLLKGTAGAISVATAGTDYIAGGAGAATTTVTCSGGTSCTGFVTFGSSPVTISSTAGLSSYDAWLHQSTYGATASATTSPLWAQSGLYASSTVAFGTAGKDLFFNASSGFLGIGTTSPWAQLSINPTAANGTAPQFVIGSSTATNFIVTNAGLVGIGTTSPIAAGSAAGSALTVGGGAADGFINIDAGSANTAQIRFYQSDVLKSAIYGGTDSKLHFFVNGSDRALIDTTGNVGIGTSSPNYALDILSTANTGFHLRRAGQVGLQIDGDAANERQLQFASNGSLRWVLGTEATAESGANAGSNFFIRGQSDSGAFLGNYLTILRSSGNVGIGTTTPGALLSLGDTGNNTINISATATSTFGSGINIRTGCFAVNGSCVGGGSFSNTIANGGTATTTFYNGGVVFYNSTLGTLSQASAQSGLFYDNTNSRLGIGTSSPTTNLYVQGQSSAPSLTTDSALFSLRASTGVQLNAGGSNTSPFGMWLQTKDSTNGGTSYPLALNPLGGNVGIGTTSPSAKLELTGTAVVNGSGAWGTGSVGGDVNASTARGLMLGYSATDDIGWIKSLYNNNSFKTLRFGANNMSFWTDNGSGTLAERLTISTAGNVGIGTTTPGSKLEVYGDTYLGGIALNGGDSNTASPIYIHSDKDYQFNGNSIYSNANSGLSIQTRWNVANTNLILQPDRGNVGIGTTTPQQKLEVNGAITVAGARAVPTYGNGLIFDFGGIGGTNTGSIQGYDYGAATARNLVLEAVGGNVGIGTTTPQTGLTYRYASDDGSATRFRIANDAFSGVLRGVDMYQDNGGDFILNNRRTDSSLGAIRLQTNDGSTRVSILNGGNVGIGTTTPQWKLNIADASLPQLTLSDGSLTSAPFNFRSINGNFYISTSSPTTYATTTLSALTIASTGNVGIGTTTPAAKLSVAFTGAFSPGAAWDSNVATFGTGVGSSVGGALGISYDNTNGGSISSIIPGVSWKPLSLYSNGINFNTSAGAAAATFTAVGNVGIGTTTPAATLQVVAPNTTAASLTWGAASGQILRNENSEFAFGLSSASPFPLYIQGRTSINTARDIVLQPLGGNIGIGTTSPWRKFSVTDTSAQFVTGYDSTRYTQFSTDSVGDLTITPQGSDILSLDSNLWICAGGACPSGTPAGTGNIIAETALGVGTSTPWAGLSVASGKAIIVAENTLATSTSMTVDWRNGNQQLVRMGTSATTISFTGYVEGQKLVLTVCNPTTTGGAISWGTQVLWSSATAPTQTTTANKCDVWSFLATQATSSLKIFGSQTANF